MRLTRELTIAGYPALQMRALFREACSQSHGVTSGLVKRALAITDDDAVQAVIQTLKAEGFIEEHRPTDRLDEWRVTMKGAALATVPASRPIHRATAERHLAALLERVRALPGRDFLYLAAEVLVFGSYLDEGARLGDLDIAIRLVPKIADESRFWKLCEERVHSADRRFRNFVEQVSWPETEVKHFVNARPRGLAIRWEVDDFVWSQRCKVTYVNPDWAARWLDTHRDRASATTPATRPPIPRDVERPLILDTHQRLRDALKVALPENASEGTALRAISEWARAGGYDALVITSDGIAKDNAPIERPVTLAFTQPGDSETPDPTRPPLFLSAARSGRIRPVDRTNTGSNACKTKSDFVGHFRMPQHGIEEFTYRRVSPGDLFRCP
ncbi:MAG: hypothetical protein HY682_07120 [Chloroflexi bacterium]|nr:hypothetical protein [Chloroflexota bacterium]